MSGGLTKHINILDFTLASLWRRRLKNLSVLAVFAGVIFLVASFQMVTQALTETASQVLRSAPEITLQRMSAGRQVDVPEEYARKLSKIFGIRDVVPRIWGYYFDEVNGANYTVLGIEPDRMPLGEKLHISLAEGSMFNSETRGNVVLGRSVHSLLQEKGSSLLSMFRPDLSQASFMVSGISRMPA